MWIKGETDDFYLGEPDFIEIGRLKGMGEHTVTAKVTLVPDFEAALNDLDVMAYWPKPIEFTKTIKYSIKVMDADAEFEGPPDVEDDGGF